MESGDHNDVNDFYGPFENLVTYYSMVIKYGVDKALDVAKRELYTEDLRGSSILCWNIHC